jgi:hypothetical protein
LFDGELRHQAEFLEHRTDADDARAVRREIGYLSALISERTGIGRIGAGDDIDQRRFAGAVFAEQDVNFAAPYVEVDAVKRDDAGKPLRNIGEFEKEVGIVAGALGGPPVVVGLDRGHLRNRQSRTVPITAP